MPSTPLRIEHVALYTADLEATRDFFERYFHATAGPLYHNPTKQFRSYFLTFPGGGARLEIMTRPVLLPSATAGSLRRAHTVRQTCSDSNPHSQRKKRSFPLFYGQFHPSFL